ncbi:MAG: 6-phosphogluconolactonase [Pseudomonadota bacterium]
MSNVSLIDAASPSDIADWVEARLAAALDRSGGSVAITVPGGSTPFPIFELLATRTLDWLRITVWPGDDRIVPEDHEASNTGKLRAIFEQVGAKVMTLTEAKEPPEFAIAWLGMGGDGHIASLFPNTDPQIDDQQLIRRLTPDPLPPEAPFDRITLTIPALLNAAEVMFTLGGSAEKRDVFEAAMRGEHDLPIARFMGAAPQPVTCFT